ncbi:toll-like receptor 1 [Engraulis encrasicolus]|uniref:toll-like receptor 1 n=1 Tax=Engraulis encrasicolus TaxID=184585 RepID=UPI002FD0A15B
MDFIWALAVLLGSLPYSDNSDMSTIVMDLSSQNLTSVPDGLPPETQNLDLSCNHIGALKRKDFKRTPQLQSLNLSNNVIQSIDWEVFLSSQDLKVLDLSHNKLRSLLDQRYLQLTPNLAYLDLSFNDFVNMTLDFEFTNLQKLEDLKLSSEVIRNEDFASISKLQLKSLNLFVSNNTSYEIGSLANVTSKKLIISSQSDCDRALLNDAVKSFAEVKLVGIAVDKFEPVTWQRGAIDAIKLEFGNTSATWEDLTSVVNNLLRSSVKHLSFTGLTITKMDGYGEVATFSNMESLTIQQAIVTVFLFSQEMLYDFIINTPVHSLTVAQTPIVHMTCPHNQSKIRILNMGDCALSEKVFSSGKIECSTLKSVETLVLKGNNFQDFKQLSSRVSLMSSLSSLDLSHNKLSYRREQGNCSWPSNITHLNLSFNSFDSLVFLCLPQNITDLDLQNNGITAIPTDIFKYKSLKKFNLINQYKSLKVLDLTHNRFHNIPDCTAFPNLQTLLLRGNSLQSPSLDFLNTCPMLQFLDASHNSFICTCSLREFTSILGKTTTAHIKFLHWPRGYHCSYPEDRHGTLLEDFSLPPVSCSAALLATTILVPAIALVIAVAVLCRQLDGPWYMSMICQWARAKHRGARNKDKPEDLQGVLFHAFVSYSQRNAEWVKGQLIPRLEGEDAGAAGDGLRVCHHEQDFVPGKTIVENILRCVEMSRRCIFVLSSDFVRSEWCHYELCFANHQRVAKGFDCVILVLLEPLPQYMIPSKYYQLKDMMSRRTYLEWPPERTKQVLFWANLRAALYADLPTEGTQRDGQEGTE